MSWIELRLHSFLYLPQCGHVVCGNMSFPQFGHLTNVGRDVPLFALLLLDLDRVCFFFGVGAIASLFYQRS